MLTENTIVTLTGVVDTVTHKNPENGFGILKLKVELRQYEHLPCVSKKGIVCIVGPLGNVELGQKVTVKGTITHHKTYGAQVKVEDVNVEAPKTQVDIERYLANQIALIGPKFARQIVELFGDDTYKVIDETPERLLEIEGIGRKRLEAFVKVWAEQKSLRELRSFCSSIGITPAYIDRVFKKYGMEAIAVIRQDPYALSRDINGIGFLKADEVARHLGIPETSPLRVRAAAEYVLDQAATTGLNGQAGGHVYMYDVELYAETVAFLRNPQYVNTELVRQVVEQSIGLGLFVREENRIYLASNARMEAYVARRLGEVMTAPLPFDTSQARMETMLAAATEAADVALDDTQKHAVYKALTNKVFVLTGGPGTGKGLALDTPIPTPNGWKTMGDIVPGDQVFDENGKPCTVTFVSDINHRPCYEVKFDDGAVIIADDEHLWMTSTRAARKSAGRRRDHSLRPRGTDQSHLRVQPAIVDTKTLATTVHVGKDRRLNHSIPLCGPLTFTRKRLPIDPYVLGVWLGNGDNAGAYITDGDPLSGQEVARLGYVLWDRKAREGIFRHTVRMPDGSPMTTVLREMSLLDNKHIPSKYLTTCEEDRWSLLQGLMDTDGYCSESGRCEITFVEKILSDSVYQLACGLGIKCHRDSRPAMLDGRQCGTAYRVSFTTDRPVFRVSPHKSRVTSDTRTTTKVRYVTSVTPVASVPTKCIQVDSASRLYLAGQACVVTHNTTTTKAIVAGLSRAVCHFGGAMQITCLAPTGRAAKRMREVIKRPASTIHRLLYQLEAAKKEDPRANEHRKLRGAIILDEVSMLDLKVMAWLLSWVSDEAILIFVGDKDQLPSVGCGAVLRDLLEAGNVATTQLTQVHRQAAGSDIVVNAHLINQGRAPRLALYGQNYGVPATDMYAVCLEDDARQVEAAVWCATEMARSLGFDPHRDCQVMAPMHKGQVGVANLNAFLQQRLNPTPARFFEKDGGVRWGIGDKLMQLSNNYKLGVFNGDIGVVTDLTLNDNNKLKDITLDFDGESVKYEQAEDWYDLTLAYASTVHKMQGSECPMAVIVVHTAHWVMLQRNLLYTAITRGKKCVVLIYSPQALDRAVHNNDVARRNSFLAEKLRRFQPARDA